MTPPKNFGWNSRMRWMAASAACFGCFPFRRDSTATNDGKNRIITSPSPVAAAAPIPLTAYAPEPEVVSLKFVKNFNFIFKPVYFQLWACRFGYLESVNPRHVCAKKRNSEKIAYFQIKTKMLPRNFVACSIGRCAGRNVAIRIYCDHSNSVMIIAIEIHAISMSIDAIRICWLVWTAESRWIRHDVLKLAPLISTMDRNVKYIFAYRPKIWLATIWFPFVPQLFGMSCGQRFICKSHLNCKIGRSFAD